MEDVVKELLQTEQIDPTLQVPRVPPPLNLQTAPTKAEERLAL